MQVNRDWLERPRVGVAAGCLAVAVVTGAVAILENFVPVLSLGALYVFAVLPVAVLWGVPYGVGVAVASMLTFNFLFLPPVHSLTLADRRNWLALAVYVTTAIVVGGLASSARRRRDDAEQREQEAALLADIAAELLRGRQLQGDLASIAERAAGVLGVSSARIVLGEPANAHPSEAPYPMDVGGETIGFLYAPQQEEPALGVRRRLLPALASLLAVARDRERLARDAFETEALRRSDTIKTAVIQAVSHDLRTPLATIEQALDGLESGVLVLSDEDRTELLETVRIEHARLKRFVENLLDLSRLQAGAAQSMPELWTGEELVAQAVEELGVGTGRVRVDGRPDLPPVSVDALQIQRVLVNLIENALSVSPPGESVHVRVTATRKELLIRVTDRGPGIPDDERERIFEPFHRIERRSGQRGAGLGLTIARGFTDANGGRLWVESRAGQGASFVLALPAVELPAEVPV
jgi:two-component system sensor histidine kinase KdpD